MGDRAKDGRDPRGERNGNAVLTDELVRTIRLDPRPAPAVGADYGIHRQTVVKIRARKTWKHVA